MTVWSKSVRGHWGSVGQKLTERLGQAFVVENKPGASVPDIQASFAGQGLDPVSSTPDEFQSMIERDIPRWAKVVRDARIQAE